MSKVRPLNPILEQLAITELCEDPNSIAKEIASVRQWIKEQPELGKYQLSDQFIASFIRSCKYNHEKVRKKLPKYLTMRLLCPEIFANRKIDDDTMDIIRTGVHLFLATPMDKDSSRIHISQFGKLDTRHYTVYQSLKILYMMLEVNLLEDDNTAVAGCISIEDMTGVTLSHLISMNLMVLKRILNLIRSGLPHRTKGIHIINAPWFTSWILNICRSLLPPKLQSRFFVHRKIEDLFEYVPQRLLPAEYGGENDSVEDAIKVWERKMLHYREYFDHDLQYGTGHEHEIEMDDEEE